MVIERPPAGDGRERPARAAPTDVAIARAVSWVAAGYGLSQVAWFGSLVVLAAALAPRDFGTVAIATFLIGAAALLQDAGTGGGIVTAGRLTRSELRRSIARNVAVGTVIVLAAVTFAEPIVDTFSKGGDPDVLRALVLTIALHSTTIVPNAVLVRALEFKRATAAGTTSAVCGAAAALLAVALGAGVWALVVRQVVASGLRALLIWAVGLRVMHDEVREPSRPFGQDRRESVPWFLLLGVTNFVALNIDFLIVGNVTNATELGLYSLAFTLGFAPLHNFAWPLGGVLFPAAAAAADLQTVARRTVQMIRLSCLILLPFVPPLIVLAPEVLPAVFGPEWEQMVVPFQLLLVAGVGQAVVNAIGESLSGRGGIAFRALVHVGFAAVMVVGLLVLVPLDGIRGAAAAHVLALAFLATFYLTAGIRRVNVDPRALATDLRGLLLAVAVQSALTAALAIGLSTGGVSETTTAWLAASAGLLVVMGLVVLLQAHTLRESVRVLKLAWRRAGP